MKREVSDLAKEAVYFFFFLAWSVSGLALDEGKYKPPPRDQ